MLRAAPDGGARVAQRGDNLHQELTRARNGDHAALAQLPQQKRQPLDVDPNEREPRALRPPPHMNGARSPTLPHR